SLARPKMRPASRPAPRLRPTAPLPRSPPDEGRETPDLPSPFPISLFQSSRCPRSARLPLRSGAAVRWVSPLHYCFPTTTSAAAAASLASPWVQSSGQVPWHPDGPRVNGIPNRSRQTRSSPPLPEFHPTRSLQTPRHAQSLPHVARFSIQRILHPGSAAGLIRRPAVPLFSSPPRRSTAWP